MPSFKVKVKWGKELYKDVEVNTDEDPLVFKAQLFALTSVQPERQKIMIKGAVLKDEGWANIKLSEGATILLMGTADELPQMPSEKSVFIEDMTESDLAKSMDFPAGLQNLGNTCYLNAIVQCLHTVPELRTALENYKGKVTLSTQSDYSESIVASLRELFKLMIPGRTLTPVVLLQLLRLAFPRFAEKSSEGSPIQQDANECWVELVRILQQNLPAFGNPLGTRKTFIDQYFGGTFEVEWKCTESEEEAITYQTEEFYQLSCFITPEVKYMMSGLKNTLQENVTKNSAVLERNAVYLRKNRINRLPAYLAVQFVRFFYKGNSKVNAKILKDIKFPLEFDAYELCTKKLQDQLDPAREKFKKLQETEITNSLSHENVVKKGDEKPEVKYKVEPFSFADDPGSNNSGYYTLQAVLTHKGRSSSTGHYVGWVLYKGKWMKCDDDVIYIVPSEEVLKLSGGGDWHTAYVLLYGPKELKIPEESMQTE